MGGGGPPQVPKTVPKCNPGFTGRAGPSKVSAPTSHTVPLRGKEKQAKAARLARGELEPDGGAASAALAAKITSPANSWAQPTAFLPKASTPLARGGGPSRCRWSHRSATLGGPAACGAARPPPQRRGEPRGLHGRPPRLGRRRPRRPGSGLDEL